jgi:hypothetical protein
MALSVRSKAIKSVRVVTFLAVAALAMPGLAKAQPANYSQIGFIPIPGLASFDISWVDYAQGGYYLADRTNKAIDFSLIGSGTSKGFSANFVGAVVGPTGAVNNDQSGPNGVLTIRQTSPGTGQGTDIEIWAGDGPQLNQGCPSFLAGKCSTAKVIDQATGALKHVIPTGGASRADELCFDKTDHLILIANDAEADFAFGTPFISFISTDTYEIASGMAIPQTTNGIEQCNWDPSTGFFYLNIPEVGGHGADTADGNVLVIQPPAAGHTPVVQATFIIPNPDCAGPQGQAVGPGPQLLLGCNAVSAGTGIRNSIVLDKTNGSIIDIFWGVGGSDEVWSNDTNYFLTGSSCTAITCINAPNGSQFGVADHSPTTQQVVAISPLGGVSSHSIAADCSAGSMASSGQLFLPVAGGVNIFTNSDAVTPGTCPAQ